MVGTTAGRARVCLGVLQGASCLQVHPTLAPVELRPTSGARCTVQFLQLVRAFDQRSEDLAARAAAGEVSDIGASELAAQLRDQERAETLAIVAEYEDICWQRAAQLREEAQNQASSPSARWPQGRTSTSRATTCPCRCTTLPGA